VIAFGPRAVFVARSSPLLAAGLAEIELRTWGERRFGPAEDVRRYQAAPFDELERMLADAQLPAEARAQLPEGFVGGAVGFVGYDAARLLERLPERAARDLDVPELCFLFVDVVLRLDHKTRVAEWVASARGRDQAHARSRCAALLADYSERWARGASTQTVAAAPGARCPEVSAVHAYADEEGYAASVRAAQDHILAGDAFEVCISQRLEVGLPSSRAAAWALYRALRAQSPAPFACCVLTPWASLLSSSPERFLQLGTDRWAESRPIKGTRPRGADAAEDEALMCDLATSEKDRAENVMIVDLVRNDLGRVCEVGSVHVPELMVVETHPRVFQLVSSVRGRLEDGVSPVALFCACFPPGSMTGAPKIESMKIIDDLEPYRRALYAGAVGYFDLGGAMDFSVVIRSFVIVGERCTFSVGGAVVADSDPVGEYRESMDKARALLAALEAERARGDEAADPR
jgi:aminodeoxychorismate synthase component I